MRLIREGLDVSHLKASMAAHRDEFKKELFRNKLPIEALDSPCIYLRMAPFPIDRIHDTIHSLRVVNWPVPQLVPNVMAALVDLNHLLEGQLARASLVAVTNGLPCSAHPNEGTYADRVNRFHLCITAGPEDAMRPGDLCQVEKKPLTWSELPEGVLRLHLICDQWKPEAAGILQPAQMSESPPVLPQEDRSMPTPKQRSTAAAPQGKARKKPSE